jgi:L-aminopeptidase/D-esterase-like protein
VLGSVAADVLAEAVVRAVRAATALGGIPGVGDLAENS